MLGILSVYLYLLSKNALIKEKTLFSDNLLTTHIYPFVYFVCFVVTLSSIKPRSPKSKYFQPFFQWLLMTVERPRPVPLSTALVV